MDELGGLLCYHTSVPGQVTNYLETLSKSSPCSSHVLDPVHISVPMPLAHLEAQTPTKWRHMRGSLSSPSYLVRNPTLAPQERLPELPIINR